MQEVVSPPAPIVLPSLTDLLNKAYARTKERFISYFLLILLSGLPLVILFSMLLSLFILIRPLFFVLIIPVGVTASIIYLCLQFAAMAALLGENKRGVKEILSEVKPLLRGYLWFTLLYFLFFIGILPFGVISLGIIFILWGFWGFFSVFVYFDHRKKGLDNVWYSRALVRQQPWAIVKKLIAVVVLVTVFSVSIGFIKNTALQIIWQILFAVVLQPFLISFYYEVYRSVPAPQEVKRPKGWLIASGIGWIFVILFILSIVPFFWRRVSLPVCRDGVTTRCTDLRERFNDRPRQVF